MSAIHEGQHNWQALYGQLLSQYSGLASHLQAVNSENTALFHQLELLYQERIALQDESHTEQLEVPEQLAQPQPQTELPPVEPTRIIRNRRQRPLPESLHRCTYQNCDRVYKSAVSMNLHIKIKHNGGTKKEREAAAKLLLESQQRGLPPPPLSLNLPPNFLEEFRKNYEYTKKYNM